MSDLEPMRVENPTIALELLAKDAAPLQSIRELTHNSIQAIQAAGDKGGVIEWDVDWVGVEAAVSAGDEPIYRLTCTDNGEGMTADEQQKYINRLFVSGRTQAADKNFGIGAKVTAGAKNPAGVEYRSWRAGGSSRIVFERGEDGGYGLRRFDVHGKVDCWMPVPEAAKPEIVDGHGTAVVLHGTTGNEHTILPPSEGIPGGMKWLARYLNQRYLEFPPGVQVFARELPAEQSNWPTKRPVGEMRAGSRRRVTGMREWLQRNRATDLGEFDASGITHLADGARVHWWVLDPEAGSDVHWSRGHSAAVFQGEIYDSLEANANRIRLQQFGVFYSSKRVVIYVEPAGDVTATMARDSLRVGGEPLPWERWGAAFKQDLPPSIVEVERKVRDASSETDHNRAIRERLKSYEDLFKITSWRAAEDGSVKAWGESPSGGTDRGTGRGGDNTSKGSASGGSGTSRRDYLSMLDDDGVPAEPINPDRDIPTVDWVAFSSTDRQADRAAEYVRSENKIFANTEFRVFSDMVDRLAPDYSGAGDEALEVVRDTVREWYEQVLIESVIRSWNFEHERHWQDQEYEKLTSPESLTMAVLPFTFIHSRLRQIIGTKIGAAVAAG